MSETIRAYWFSDADGTLRYGDGRKAKVGITHTVEGDVKIWRGLRASKHPLDALRYADGTQLWLVELSGTVIVGNNGSKLSASSRKYLATFDATEMLHKYAQSCNAAGFGLNYTPWGAALEAVKNELLETNRMATKDAVWRAGWNVGWDKASYAAWTLGWAMAWTAAMRETSPKLRARFARMVNYRMKKAMEAQR